MLIALYLALFGGGAGPAFTVDMFLAETKTAVIQIVEDVDREQRVVNVIEGLELSVGDFREQRVEASKELEAVDANYASGSEDYMKAIREMEKAWLDFEFEVAKSHIEVTEFLTDEEWEALFDHLKKYRKSDGVPVTSDQ
jgi:hypothetical protein